MGPVGDQGSHLLDIPDVVLVSEAVPRLTGLRIAPVRQLPIAVDGVVAPALQLIADGGLAGAREPLDQVVPLAHRWRILALIGEWTRRRSKLALVVVALAGCGLANPTLDPAQIPPPDVMANDVSGVVVTYCRPNYCADGGIDFLSGDYPTVELPVTLTFEEPIGYITAHATALSRDDAPVEMIGVDTDGRPLRDAITIDQLPPGEWQVLSVFVGFDGEVSSSVVWRLSD